MVYSFLCDPVSFSAKTSFLFDDSEDGGYRKIFGDGVQVWDTMPEDEFKIRSAIWWMSDAFAIRLADDRKKSDDQVVKLALERKYILIFAARLLLERGLGPNGYQAHLAKEFQGEWRFGEKPSGKWFEALYGQAKATVIMSYKIANKSANFVHRNWMRDKTTMDGLKDVVYDVLEPLPPPTSYSG